MQYSLYEYYSHSSMDLYEVRKHYLEHFYYQNHSRNKADGVLRSIANSSKVSKILDESLARKVAPNYIDFLTTVCSMMKFMFQSNETNALAAMDAALRWDIEVNSSLHLKSPLELKQDVIRVFKKLMIYEEMPEGEYFSIVNPHAESVEEHMEDLPSVHDDNQTTWSLMAFSHEFGRMQVREFCRKDDGELFKACVFTKGKYKTYVGFSSKLGVLTPSEIEEMKEELVVIKSPSGNYNLYKRISKEGDVNL